MKNKTVQNGMIVIDILTIGAIWKINRYGGANEYVDTLNIRYGNVSFTNGLTLLYNDDCYKIYDTPYERKSKRIYDKIYNVGDKVRVKYQIYENRFTDGNILLIQEPDVLFGSEQLDYEAPKFIKDFFDEVYFEKQCLMTGKYKDKYKNEDFLGNRIEGKHSFRSNEKPFIWLYNNGKLPEKYIQDYIVNLSYWYGITTNGYDGVNKEGCYKNISKISKIDYDLFSKVWDEKVVNSAYDFREAKRKGYYFPDYMLD